MHATFCLPLPTASAAVPNRHISRITDNAGCTRCHITQTQCLAVNHNVDFLLQVAGEYLCTVPMRGVIPGSCGFKNALGFQKRNVSCRIRRVVTLMSCRYGTSSLSSSRMPRSEVLPGFFPLSTGNQGTTMNSITTDTALDILIAWLQDTDRLRIGTYL